LAATLQGLELLHASAVEVDGRVVAFVARAGTGKTSVAAHAVALGGRLVTDDVLALELVHDRVVAHPGGRTVNISPAELRGMSEAGRSRLGDAVGRAGKVVLGADVIEAPARLHALYFLERPVGDALRIDDLGPDPHRVLAHSFNTYVRSPARIRNQLDVLSVVTATVPAFSVAVPPGLAARDVARHVVEHIEALG
jgi:hypothetical protein